MVNRAAVDNNDYAAENIESARGMKSALRSAEPTRRQLGSDSPVTTAAGPPSSAERSGLERFCAAGLSWLLPEEMTDAMFEARLFADAGTKQGHRRHVEPDWASLADDHDAATLAVDSDSRRRISVAEMAVIEESSAIFSMV